MRHTVATAFGVVLFAAALAVLHHQLGAYHYHEVVAALRDLPESRLALAALLTGLNYLALTGYDVLGLRFVGKPLPYAKTAFASFLSYVFAHNVGASFLGGAAVRLHLYSGWGLSGREVAGLLGFNVVTFWLGLLATMGLGLLAGSPPSGSVAAPRLAGVTCLLAVTAYLVLTALRARPLRWRRWELPLPALRLAVAQLVVSSVDWLLAAGVLWVLLPPGRPGPLSFLALFLLAQVAGVASSVPAGLGVFEVVMLHLLAPAAPATSLVASLLAYRAVYYLLPLILAALLLGAYELRERRAMLRRVVGGLGRWLPVPQLFAVATFLAGIVLLASGATPAARGRLPWLAGVVPLPAIEVSHFAGSIAGAALLLLAWGLQRRLDGAWVITTILLALGVIASLVKGLDFEEALLLALLLAALVPCRPRFHRRTSLLDEPFSLEWAAAVLLVMLGTAWLLFFSYKHVEYSSELWWQFELGGDTPRSLRATVGAGVLLVCWGLARLLRPVAPRAGAPRAEDLARVRELVAQSRRSSAYLALLGDKRFLFDRERSGFIMYANQGRSWVALGDPVGAPEAARDLAWHFRELSDRHAGWTVFYEIGPALLPLYLDLGLVLRKLGEEARVPLPGFGLEGGARKSLRQGHHRGTRDGLRFAVVPPAGVDALLPLLAAISDAWLAEKHTREKGFSLGFFATEYLKQLPVAVVRQEDAIVAFTNLLPGAEHEELSCDLMRYRSGTHPALMEFLFAELLLWGKREGYRWFNLGMAPFSGLESRPLAPLWNRLGALLFQHGEHFYNFQGLRQFKEKFDPVWEPRYLAAPGGVALPRILANVAALISGGLGGVVGR